MFPYKAFVAADEVYVRSGPGENYYPTDKLKTGNPVEVYRHDPGGWCAFGPCPGASPGFPRGICDLEKTTLPR